MNRFLSNPVGFGLALWLEWRIRVRALMNEWRVRALMNEWTDKERLLTCPKTDLFWSFSSQVLSGPDSSQAVSKPTR